MRGDSHVHVAFAAGAHRSPPASVVAHWTNRADDADPVDDALTAFTQLTKCLTPLDVLIAADSLINRRILTQGQVEGVLGRSARGRRLLRQVDGAAESGTETIFRTRLTARGIRFRTQVPVEGVGRVDFMVGDRLVVEVDGREWHDTEAQFERDRARDSRLVALGYLVMRFSFVRVMYDLPEVECELLAVVRAREHLRLARHDRIARNYGRSARPRT
jgi:very-short-patch-repair endonuclease